MKRIISLFTSLIMVISLVGVVPVMSVEATTFGDYEYTVLNDGTVEITKYKGSATTLSIPTNISERKVTRIGDYALYGCESITSVTIPNSITSIGYKAFCSCPRLTSVTIPDNVLVVDDGAFAYCSNLTSVIVPDSISDYADMIFNETPWYEKNYGSDNSDDYYDDYDYDYSDDYEYGVLSDGTVEITEYSGFETNLTIPSTIDGKTVTSIGDWAFGGCKNLINIIIPNGVKRIGNRAFYACSNLKSIELPEGVISIGDYAFHKCISLNGITIPNSCINIGACAFLDTPILNNQHTDIKYVDNWVVDSESSVTKVSIKSGAVGIVECAFLNCSKLTNIELPDSIKTIDSWACYLCPVLKCINIPYSVTYIGSDPFYYCSSLTSINVDDNNEYYSSQDGVLFNKEKTELIKYPIGNAKTAYNIKSSVTKIDTGAFRYCSNLKSITIPKSIINIGCEAFYDCTSLKDVYYSGSESDWNKISIDDYNSCLTNATIHFNSKAKGNSESFGGTATNITNNQGIKFDKNVSFKMPDNIPGIGGEEFKLNLNSLGISYYQDSSSFKVGIGVTEELLKDKDKMSTFKKLVETNKNTYAESMSKYIQAQTKGDIVSLGATFKPEASVYGYIEGTIDKNGNRHVGTGKLVAKFKAKVSNEWQVVVVNIPVVISASLEASAQGTVNVTMPENKKIDINGELKITIPKIELGAGVGLVKVANVQAYGSIQNDLTLVKSGVKDTITGEAGVKVEVLGFDYKHVLWQPSKDLVVYDSNKKSAKSSANGFKLYSGSALKSSNYEVGELTKSVQMNKSDNGNSNIKTLLSGCNNNASPQVVKFNNNKALMIYTDSVPSRSNINQSAVMYKTYDGSTWSDAVILSDDGTPDYYPQVSSDGTTAYITWINANRVFNASEILDDVSKACDISVISFDSNSMAVSGSTVDLSNDDTLDMLPVVTTASTPTVAWVKNSNNDVLTNTGTNTIYYSTFDGDSWTSAVEYTSHTNPILELSVGTINDNTSFAYIVDEDTDMTTMNDVEVYTGSIDSQPTRLTNNDINEQSVKYRTINGVDSFVWCADNNLEYTTDLSTIMAMYNLSSITGDYDIVNIDGKDKVIFSNTEDDKANIYACQIDGGFFVDEPVQITESGGYSRNISATDLNNRLLIAFTRTNAEISSDDIDTSTDLCVYESESYHKLQVTKLEFDDNDVAPGKEVQVTATVTNNGMIEQTNSVVSIKVGDQTYTGTINDTLSPGDSYDLPINISMPSTNVQVEMIATATPASGSNIENIEFKEIIGGTDLQLAATTTDDKVVVNVNNISGYDSDAKLVIRKENESGDLVKEISLGNIKSNQTVTEEISNDDLTSGVVYFNVIATNTERYTLDNNAYLYIDKAPKFNNLTTTSISENSAFVKCDINLNGLNGSQVGAYYGTTSACSTKAGSDNLGSSNIRAGYTLSNLSQGTTYYYRFYIIADGTTYWSGVQSFKTKSHVHSYTTTVVKPNCTEKGYTLHKCSTCGNEYKDTYTNATGHTFGSWTTTKQATCTTTGTQTRKCTVCGATETKTTAKTVHTYKKYTTKATLTKNGSIVEKCSVCGAKKPNSTTTVIYYPKTITLAKTSYVYNGKVQKPAVTVKDAKGKVIAKSNYTVTYSSGCKNVGKYAVKVTFKGNYSGSKMLYYTIIPKGTAISRLTAAKRGFTATWAKNATQTTGYQIQYTTDSKFKSGVKTVTINKNTTVSKAISKLTGGKKYYVRVRTYRTVNKVNYFSAWSGAKAVTTKK